MHRQSQTTAEADSIDHRDQRRIEFRESKIELIFCGEEFDVVGMTSCQCILSDPADVPTGAEGLVTGAVEDQYRTGGPLPLVETCMEGMNNIQRQCVQRFRPVQRDASHRPVAGEDDSIRLSGHLVPRYDRLPVHRVSRFLTYTAQTKAPRFSLMHGGYSMFHCGIRSATAHPRPGRYRSGECGRATDRRKPGSIVGSGCPSTTGSAAASRWAHRFSVSARRRPSGPRNVGNIRSPRQFVRSASRTSALRRAGAVVAIAEVNPTCPRLKND